MSDTMAILEVAEFEDSAIKSPSCDNILPFQLSESILEHSESVSGVASGAIVRFCSLVTESSRRFGGFSARNPPEMSTDIFTSIE